MKTRCPHCDGGMISVEPNSSLRYRCTDCGGKGWIGGDDDAKHYRCRNGDVPCACVLAGGICSDMPDPREDEDPRDQEDREGGRYY